jgi:hypothetical protein
MHQEERQITTPTIDLGATSTGSTSDLLTTASLTSKELGRDELATEMLKLEEEVGRCDGVQE